MWKHSPCQKPRPFPNEQVKTKAYELWKARDGKGGSPELEDLKKAIDSLKAERSPMEWASDYTHSNIQRIWKWTGIGDKKLWDILQLLIVPMLLAVGGYYLNQQASQRQDKLADDRRKQDQQLADDRRKQDQQLAEERAKQETLNKYLDQMSELLMNKGLRKARLEDEVFVLAQSRTTTALRDLDTKRQTLLLQFLSSADLLAPKGKTGILQEAFLSDANLRGVNLRNANLQGANLRNVNLQDVDLQDADLQGASLIEAKLQGTNFSKAKLQEAILWKANLQKTALQEANLQGADLSTANLQGATFLELIYRKQN